MANEFKCKHPGCSFLTTGPTKLGAHYRESPSHAPGYAKGPKRKYVRRAGPDDARIIGSQPRDTTKLCFCPGCGIDLRKLKAIEDLL